MRGRSVVDHRTHNPVEGGSIPPPAIKFYMEEITVSQAYEDAKQRLGNGSETEPGQAPQQRKLLTAAYVHQRQKEVETGIYTLTEGDFAGHDVEYRALKPLDYQLLQGTPITGRMASIGMDSQDLKQQTRYLGDLSHAARVELVTEEAELIVVAAMIEPRLTSVPQHLCPDDRVSIDVISKVDLFNLKKAIENISGVKQAEDTFPETDEPDNADAGESESDGAVESDDSSADGGDLPSEPV